VFKRLFGRVVLAVVVVLALWFVVSRYHGNDQFGCQIRLTAAGSDDCPTTLEQAAHDPERAAARIEAINARVATSGKKYTYGEFYDQDGTSHWYASGQDADSDNAQTVGRAAGVFPMHGTVITVDHVEVKVAARMRQARVGAGVLVINNPSGPCGQDTRGQYSCSIVVPKLLPIGTSLAVWWPGPDAEGPEREILVGGAR
jgi:hypothetical protein